MLRKGGNFGAPRSIMAANSAEVLVRAVSPLLDRRALIAGSAPIALTSVPIRSIRSFDMS